MTMGKRQKNTPRLSLCMIVKNEERYLQGCLAGAKPFVDEIIIVDTGSTDRTVEIAKAFGARLFHEEWRNDFATARNASLRHATGDWILVLDADERLPADSGKLMRRLLDAPDVAAYLVKLQCPTHGGGTMGTIPVKWPPRLFRNRVEARYEGIVHECLLPSLRGTGRIVYSDVALDHLGYLQSREAMQAKATRNLRLLEHQVAETPEDSLTWIQLAETYLTLAWPDQAVVSYRKALTLFSQERKQAQWTISNATAAIAYQQLGVLLLSQEKPEEAITALQQAIGLWPALASAHLYLGLAYDRKQELATAIDHIEKAIALAGCRVQPGHPMQLIPWMPWLLKGTVQFRLHQYEATRDSLRQAIRLNSSVCDAYKLLGVTELILNQPSAALDAFETARALGDATASLFINIGTACNQLGNPKKALQAFREALTKDPESQDARLGLCQAYEQLGRWPELVEEGCALLERGVVEPALYRLLGRALQSLEAWPAAVSVYEALCAMSDSTARDWSTLAIAALGAGEPIKALQAAEHAGRLNPPEELEPLLQAVSEQTQEVLRPNLMLS